MCINIQVILSDKIAIIQCYEVSSPWYTLGPQPYSPYSQMFVPFYQPGLYFPQPVGLAASFVFSDSMHLLCKDPTFKWYHTVRLFLFPFCTCRSVLFKLLHSLRRDFWTVDYVYLWVPSWLSKVSWGAYRGRNSTQVAQHNTNIRGSWYFPYFFCFWTSRISITNLLKFQNHTILKLGERKKCIF